MNRGWETRRMDDSFDPLQTIRDSAKALYSNASMGDGSSDAYERLLNAVEELDSWDGLMWLLEHHEPREKVVLPKKRRYLGLRNSRSEA